MIRISAPHFCAGYDPVSGHIAPVIRYMQGWNENRVRTYCRTKGWTVESILPQKYYAGIGSRSTPPDVLRTMHGIACELREIGYTLRSGGASGADTAFEDGAGKAGSVLYLPWQGFNNRTRGVICGDVPWMREVAKDFHPNWEACSKGAKALHTRNTPQVLGQLGEPASSFVVCWTPGGAGGGGTGQALRIAHFCGIPVYDLGAADGLQRFRAEVLKV